jgi:hypothetical protein
MTKLIIEADLSSEELQVLISEIMNLHRDVFKKPLVLQQTDVSGSLPNEIDLTLLSRLLMFSSKYELSIQFWPEQTAVYISKDGVDLQDYGGDFKFAVGLAIEYLEQIAGRK